MEVSATEVSVSLPLLDASPIRVYECPDSDLVSVSDPDLPERTRVVGAAMKREEIRYQRQANCLPWIEDYERAQALPDARRETE
jgi:hypothetical protein